MDFPRRAGSRALLQRLHAIALRHGGRVYLAKDALLTPGEFDAMYPRADAFRAVVREVDPGGVLQSDMSRRLALHHRPAAAAITAAAAAVS
jgi:decaprenylphospho-beta-D-ribofuranose 2-oxidase